MTFMKIYGSHTKLKISIIFFSIFMIVILFLDLNHINIYAETGNYAEIEFNGQKTKIENYIFSTTGIIKYQNQHDLRWKDYKYGGKNPIDNFGCGPCVVSMIVSSFADCKYSKVTPVDIAKWSYDNSCFAENQGSSHYLIKKAMKHFDLMVSSVDPYDSERIISELSNGNVFIALMGKGHFTEKGHFIILRDLNSKDEILVADPSDYNNCFKFWKLDLIQNELREKDASGAPLWLIHIR